MRRPLNAIFIAVLFAPVVALCSVTAAAQEKKTETAEIYGIVSEKDGGVLGQGDRMQAVPVRGVAVLVKYSSKDSLYTATDFGGIFHFKNLPQGPVKLKLQKLGMKTISGEFDLSAGKNVMYFQMEYVPEELEAAKVTAEAKLVTQIADTTIFNTKLLTTMEDESARALLEQLPGVNIKGNSLYVDGKKVKRTYVNGVLVFGDNPITAVDALKADEVESIRSYDELSPIDNHRKRAHGEKDKVLDIRTKGDLASLALSTVVASGGADAEGNFRYQGIAAAAFWSEMSEYGLSALATNLPNNIKDNILYGAPTPMELTYIGQNTGAPINNDVRDIAFKANLSKHWGNRLYGNGVSASYTFLNERNSTASHALTQYYASSLNPELTYIDSTLAYDKVARHEVSLSADLKNTPLKSFYAEAKLAVDNDRKNEYNSQIYTSDAPVRLKHESITSYTRGYNLNGNLRWSDNDLGKILPRASFSLSKSANNSDSWTIDTLASSYNRRLLHSDADRNGETIAASAGVSATLRNDETKTFLLNADYSVSYRNSVSRQLAVDSLDASNPVIDLGNSFDYTYRYFESEISSGLEYSVGKLNLQSRVKYSDKTSLYSWSLPTEAKSNRHYRSVTGNFGLHYKRFQIDCYTSSAIPSIEQSSERINSSNPLMLIAGNPDLQQAYSIDALCSYSMPLGRIGNLTLNANSSVTVNPIVSKSTYFTEATSLSLYGGYTAPAGSWLYSYENCNTPLWNISGSIRLQGLYFSRKLISNIKLEPQFMYKPQYIGDKQTSLEDFFVNLSALEQLRLSRTLSFSLTPLLNYMQSKQRGGSLISQSISYGIQANATARFLKRGRFSVTNVVNYRQHLSGFGEDVLVDNLFISISWQLIKDTLSLSLTGGDLLGQASRYETIVDATSMRQTWVPSAGRYFLLSLKYNFRNKNL